ncbi:multifunctional transcriptional regulator/nicotinamide-nucleotide adenylyltransferase/ribosylnicotinamide kinase NadR [Brevibacillus invocatus]|uniref:multifunctional transcriptional regulator/nicotinamide-nucleotide adenylyltransferase/ribosylnicotinamide kinase NadR n=1 Tax=Brevibacillus invocatus TaxID=173959 RepID=UPI00203C513B|nr:multifunctional transcriptional regulator/nicotinamide-nucleotide adenylyltransferase/ribosylnicotinamide kinase NadR [Brevibacillus invocatus]MCM3081707.1 multifunctional transcriptional regulator/nicotinamide-nucleotide adenylyltransferase/ribosylnicotinamide kinase NadR [Brevibacillus invocatus]MCM3432115.1 multifunctional transcriptional regulator/nicotinamide-nucleotide adenylyltransferase/ribosylnicotinamide kinase NadR [Brevibacillus invocatus]
MKVGTVGMYGGKFLPCPHMGHVYAMIRASTMVDELHVVVAFDEEHEKKLCADGLIPHIPVRVRLRWWTQLTKDMPHVHVHAVYEQQTGHISDWQRGAEGIKAAIGKPIDTVFSSEHGYTDIFRDLYPEAQHVVIDAKRVAYPISGTMLRTEGVMKHWQMLPEIVKPYFVKKVVVVGTESCGKSTLVRNLANLYNTNYVEEWGRTYYERLGNCENITLAQDYPEIAFEHKYQEKEQLAKANKLLFIDTEAIVTQYFSMLYIGERQPILDEIARLQQYDLWLFLEPDVKWVDDGTRSFGEQEVREKNNALLKELLREFGIPCKTVSGNYQERLEQAIRYVNEMVEKT